MGTTNVVVVSLTTTIIANSQSQATCGYVTGNPSSPVQCYNGGYCSSSKSISAAGCCAGSGSAKSCQFFTKCLDFNAGMDTCPQGGCSTDYGMLSCGGQSGKEVCQTYVYGSENPWLTTYGCGADDGQYFVLKDVSTTEAQDTSEGAVFSSAAQFPSTSLSDQAATSTARSTSASPSSPLSTQDVSANTSSSQTKLPIIVSVSSILGCFTFLVAFWLFCMRRRRAQRGEQRLSVKFKDLLERKRQSEAQASQPSDFGGVCEIDGKEKKFQAKELDDGAEDRHELPA